MTKDCCVGWITHREVGAKKNLFLREKVGFRGGEVEGIKKGAGERKEETTLEERSRDAGVGAHWEDRKARVCEAGRVAGRERILL